MSSADLDAQLLLLDLETAVARLCALASALPGEEVPVARLVGRALAADVRTLHALPTFANSALDGYAVRAADTGARVIVASQIRAGEAPTVLPPGVAAGIATGGPMPEGADTVVAVERAADVEPAAAFLPATAVGIGVRPVGADAPAGTLLAERGRRVHALTASAIASGGHGGASCVRRPRVAIITTGDELVEPGRPLGPGQIHDSNTTLMAGTMIALGCEVVACARLEDEPEVTAAGFRRALAVADVVLSSGGVSVGPRDLVKAAMVDLGVHEIFWRVAIQPGKPTWAGRHADGAFVIGLPGNPLSALTALHLIVRPLVSALLGSEPEEARWVPLAEAVVPLRSRLRAVPVRVVAGRAVPLRADASHQIARASQAGALALVEAGVEEVEAGSLVRLVDVV